MTKWIVLAVSLLALPAAAHGNDNSRDRISLLRAFLSHLRPPTPSNGPGRQCNERALRNRSAEEVLESHRAALAAGDWEAVACNYADDAVVVNDGGITTGRANIVSDLQGLSGLFGGFIPQVNQEVIVSILNDRAEMGRVLFSISTECIDIPDGVDTYVIKNGRINAQTAHGNPVFKCGPPPF